MRVDYMRRGATCFRRQSASRLALGLGPLLLIGAMPLAGQTARVITNENAGGRVLHFDFPAMRVGVAEYDEGPTGTTVFYFPKGAMAAADVRGGAPGTINVPYAERGYEWPWVSAVALAGGSWYGLSAATGVANAIKNLRIASGDYDDIPGVLGAIIYDVGGRRFSLVTPDDSLGRAALESARPGWLPLGARGAGRFAMQGYYFGEQSDTGAYYRWPHSGEGGAFRTIGRTKIGVFTVVNALGTIVDRDGHVVRCRRNETGSPCPTIAQMMAERERAIDRAAGGGSTSRGGPTHNTTITLVVTNQKLPYWALKRLATQVMTSMGRAIQPFSTQDDGDALYAVTTGEIENDSLSPLELGVAASELAWDAVLSSVPDLPPLPEPASSSPPEAELLADTGTYRFPGGGRLTVTARGRGLVARFAGHGRMYFRDGPSYRLTPAQGGLFLVEGPARDVIRFDHDGGAGRGLTLNPGPWAITAARKP